MPLHVSSTCAHHQEGKIALHSLWYHHTYRWASGAQVERGSVRSQPVHETATYKCDDTGGCVMQFCPPDDEHMCSKHVEAWNKLTVKQKFCASSWLITEINIMVLQKTLITTLRWEINSWFPLASSSSANTRLNIYLGDHLHFIMVLKIF